MKDKIDAVFKQLYDKDVKKILKDRFNIINDLAIPCFEKIVVNIGVGGGNAKCTIKRASDIVEAIAAQKSVVKKAKKSIAQFHLREGMESGVMVTCRRINMYILLQRVFLGLLNWRNFKFFNEKSINVSKNKGQLTLGIPNVTIFQGVTPCINDKGLIGCSITLCAKNVRNKEMFRALLEGFGFPFMDNDCEVRK